METVKVKQTRTRICPTIKDLPILELGQLGYAESEKKLFIGNGKNNVDVSTISTDLIEDGSITTAKIVDKAITTGKVNDNAITNAKIADATIEEGKLATALATKINVVDAGEFDDEEKQRTIKIFRGLKKDLPELEEGEIGYCTDTKEFFIGVMVAEALTNVLIAIDPDELLSKITVAYKIKGSLTEAQIVNDLLVEDNIGNVYNISEQFITTADFVEGAGKTYPAGTNIVIIEVGVDTYKFDVLAGFIDTSIFLTSIPEATSGNYGGIKLNYLESDLKYKVQVDGGGKAFVDLKKHFSPTKAIETNYTLQDGDENTVLLVGDEGDITITIPEDTTFNFPLDTEIALVRMKEDDDVIIGWETGVVVNGKVYTNSFKIGAQYQGVALKKLGTNKWLLLGNFEEV